jgi:hypothetical protein
VLGFVLSPLSWWNEVIVKLPFTLARSGVVRPIPGHFHAL